jgi:DNA (cytosine-5)-methyltransferase 1
MGVPIVSLFSGAGGLDLGFRQEGFVPLVALDAKPVAVETYNLNHQGSGCRQLDLSSASAAEVAMLVEASAKGVRPRGVIGGPPCQCFSNGNVHKKVDDIRSTLPAGYARVLRELNSRYDLDFFVFENVTSMQSEKHAEVYEEFVSLLDEAGFNVFVGRLDASRFAVAQNRVRLFIVGLNRKLYPTAGFEFPVGEDGPPLTVRDAIWGLPEPAYFRRKMVPEDIPLHPNHWTMNPRSPKFKRSEAPRKSRSFRRLDWDRPSWTVAYGHREVHVHPEGHRRLSIFEAMLLQGFPKHYRLPGYLSEQVELVSDAVPPPVAAALAASINKVIARREGRAEAAGDGCGGPRMVTNPA